MIFTSYIVVQRTYDERPEWNLILLHFSTPIVKRFRHALLFPDEISAG